MRIFIAQQYYFLYITCTQHYIWAEGIFLFLPPLVQTMEMDIWLETWMTNILASEYYGHSVAE